MTPDPTDSIFNNKLPQHSIHGAALEKLEQAITQQNFIGIAVSGGADSVFLLRWLIDRYPEARHQVRVLHYNHHTRGEDSDGDEQFIQNLSDSLGVQCITGHRNPSKADPRMDEASLRDARFTFFRKAWYTHHLALLLTAHHKQDRVESLLMRLSRASALDGLIAPRAVQSFRNGLTIARPLLTLDKAQMITALQAAGQTWREDGSNQESTYYRNFIRNELLPQWIHRNKDPLIENIHQSICYLEEDAEVLNKLARSAVQSIDLHHTVFPIQQIREQPLPIQRRCIWLWLNEQGVSDSVSHRQVETLCQLQTGEQVSITSSRWIRAQSSGALELTQSTRIPSSFEPLQFCLGCQSRLVFPDGSTLSTEQIPLTSDLYKEITQGKDDPNSRIHIDLQALNGAAPCIRFWKYGMRYTPLGFQLNNSKKIKTCFIDRKIDSALRKRLPVVCNQQGEILWIPGLLPSEKGRVTAKSKLLLRLTYQ